MPSAQHFTPECPMNSFPQQASVEEAGKAKLGMWSRADNLCQEENLEPKKGRSEFACAVSRFKLDRAP